MPARSTSYFIVPATEEINPLPEGITQAGGGEETAGELLTLPLLEGFMFCSEEGENMREQLHIGEIARLVGVSAKTIRSYHHIGLLAEPERTVSGYRLYSAEHLLRLQRIRYLQVLGLPRQRIREILMQASQDHERALRVALHRWLRRYLPSFLFLRNTAHFCKCFSPVRTCNWRTIKCTSSIRPS